MGAVGNTNWFFRSLFCAAASSLVFFSSTSYLFNSFDEIYNNRRDHRQLMRFIELKSRINQYIPYLMMSIHYPSTALTHSHLQHIRSTVENYTIGAPVQRTAMIPKNELTYRVFDGSKLHVTYAP